MNRKSIVLVAPVVMLLATMAMAQDVDEIVAEHLEARGGAEKISAIETARLTGTMSMGGGQVEAPFVMKWKRPNKLRFEITLQGMVGIQAWDGESGWALMPFQGDTTAQPIPEDDAKDLAEQADFLEGPFINSEQKGYTVELIGEEDVEGTPAYKLKVTNKHGDVSNVYFDAEYFLEIKSEGKRSVRGQEIEYESNPGDYKEVDGIVFPHSIAQHIKGAPGGQVLTIETIELDVEIDDADFDMPQVEEKDESAEPEADGSE
jgi:outer membrane lipoprotein-sorting protein